MGGLHTNCAPAASSGWQPMAISTSRSGSISSPSPIRGGYTRWVEPDPEQFKVWRLAWDLLLTDRYTLE
jgi:hypothetical protein